MRPSAPISWSTRRGAPRRTTRTACVSSATQRMSLVAAKQTSSPDGVQARPEMDVFSGVRLRLVRVATSTTDGQPRSSSWSGCSRKAMRSPDGENRGDEIQAAVSWSTVPIGNSSRVRPPSVRTMARAPSGAKLALVTFSSTSRGAPPLSGTCARVPGSMNRPRRSGLVAMAMSPDRETASSAASMNGGAVARGRSSRIV